MNADDMRSIRAFLADGSELGVLDAQGAWRVMPHTLTLRRKILKEKANRGSLASTSANPIEDYLNVKLAQAKKKRKVASDLSQAVRILSAAPTVRTPVGPSKAALPAAKRDTESKPNGVSDQGPPPGLSMPVRPRKLTIGTGQVY
jgi:putative transposase